MGTATCSIVSESKATRNGQFEIELKSIVCVRYEILVYLCMKCVVAAVVKYFSFGSKNPSDNVCVTKSS